MGFYRSGEFKYFIVDAIRFILDNNNKKLTKLKKISKDIKTINSIIYTLGNSNDYQKFRVLDDFFVPKNIISIQGT